MRKGQHCTDAIKAAISKGRMGCKTPHAGVPRSPECRAKISAHHTGRKHPHKGHPNTPEARAKVSAANRGPAHYNWQGGKSYEPYCPKWTEDLRRRIRAFFDNQCILCGKDPIENGREMDCHHVEYNKAACCDGKPVQFAALCWKCHGITNYDRERWQDIMHRIIDEIYGGRSYYTREEYARIK